MKNKKFLLLGVILLLLVLASILGVYFYRHNNRLTINEKKWLDEMQRSNQVLNVNIINNASALGENGEGVLYSFLNDLEEEHSLNINKVTYNYGAHNEGISFNVKTNPDQNDIVFYEDHYVLISKTNHNISDFTDMAGKTIGILANDLSYVTNYINSSNVTFTSCDSKDDLYKMLDEDNYVIVPLHLYLREIIKKDYKIIYHLSDVNMSYVLSLSNDDFSNVLRKYYSKWKNNFSDYYMEELFKVVSNELNISSSEIDTMRSITYKYGFVNHSPYEVIRNGNYGGIAAEYLNGFSTFADIDIDFTKYNNYNKFNRALGKDEIDIYFGYNNLVNGFKKTDSGVSASYVVIANEKNDIVINSINALKGKTVYVDKGSVLFTYINNIKGINIKPYSSYKDLLKLNRKDEIAIVDKNIFDYYKNHGLNNYTSRYEGSVEYTYGFNVKENETMYKLLNEYMGIMDSKKVLNRGILNHDKTMRIGNLFSSLAKYIIALALFLIGLGLYIINKTKKITIAKKIKKEDKMRFIDQLTLLKNRNYLAENIESWNNNTIYPQCIMVIDLNRLQEINDIEGYEEGDRQIKAAANILMKSQLDNSEIIRTDGNEFVIYMVGYSQKQITNYMHKINKDFNNLPYKYGAEYGYSMIIDDIKTIEDALAEATKKVKDEKDSK